MDPQLCIQQECQLHSVASQPAMRTRRICQKMPDYLAFGRAEFNKRRKLFIQNVPPITHQDVRELMGSFVPADIVISKRLQHVIISLRRCDQVDQALLSLGSSRLAGCPVHVELYPRRMMLYICGLPLHYTDDMFREFLASYGEVETAFLSLSSDGKSKGYGFVEFAHNRVTLEKVRQTLNGYLLDNHTLYCGLVSESVRTFEDTQSKTLFCLLTKEDGLAASRLEEFLQSAQRFDLPAGSKLYALECADADTAERVWCRYALADSTGEPRLLYAMPAVPTDHLPAIVGNIQRKNSNTELAPMVRKLFSDQPQVAVAMENLLSTPEFQGRPLTMSIIMELSRRLQGPANYLQTPARQSQEPVGSLEKFANNLQRPAGYLQGSASTLPKPARNCKNLTTSSAVGQCIAAPCFPAINTPGATVPYMNTRSFSTLNKEIGGGYSGPITRSRVNTVGRELEQSSDMMLAAKYGMHKVKDIGRAGEGSSVRKRRNSGRDKSRSGDKMTQGWSIWDGIPGTEGLTSSVSVASASGETYRGKENTPRCDSRRPSGDSSEPLSKRPFRKTPGAEKRERRLLLQANNVSQVSWQSPPLVRQRGIVPSGHAASH